MLPTKVTIFKIKLLPNLYVIVISGSDIVCNNNITSSKAAEGDYIEYSCMVKYKGKWAPVMEWKKANAVLKAKDESTADTVKYTQVTMLTPEDNDQSFTCRPYFDQPKSGSTATGEADNIPTTKNVLTTHIFPKLTVYCKYRLHHMCQLYVHSAWF